MFVYFVNINCLWKRAELSHTGAEVSRDNSARAELSWAEVSVGRVVCLPADDGVRYI